MWNFRRIMAWLQKPCQPLHATALIGKHCCLSKENINNILGVKHYFLSEIKSKFSRIKDWNIPCVGVERGHRIQVPSVYDAQLWSLGFSWWCNSGLISGDELFYNWRIRKPWHTLTKYEKFFVNPQFLHNDFSAA